MTKVVFMFSGQGSQFYNMGAELYHNHPRFKYWMDECETIAAKLIGQSMLLEVFQPDKREQPFDRLLFTNPALFSVQYSLAQVLMEMGIKPDMLLGYSLGETTSAVVSSALTLEEGLTLTVESAKMLEAEAPVAPMMAVIDKEDTFTKLRAVFRNCHHTGTNFDINYVVSGLEADINRAQKALTGLKILNQKLPVNYGFHTPLMAPFEAQYKSIVDGLNFKPCQIPVVSSFTAEPVASINGALLWQVLREKVAFQTTIKNLLEQGDDYLFIDVGPSGTLSMFVKYNLPKGANSQHLEVMNQFGKDLEAFEKFKTAVLE